MLLPITIDPTKKLFSCPCSPCVGIAAQLQQFINKRPKVFAKPAKTSGNFVLLDGVELAVYLARLTHNGPPIELEYRKRS